MSRQAFFRSLSPSVREELRSVLSETDQGEARLRMLVSNYMDAEGGWPTGSTADFVARTYLHRMSDFSPRYGAMGLSGPVVAGLAGAGLSIGAGKGAVALSSGLVMRYGEDALAYSLGLQPQLLRGILNVYNRVTDVTDWTRLGFERGEPTGIGEFIYNVLGLSFQKEVRNQLTGLFADVAWRGARNALHHIQAATIGDRAEEVPWVVNFVDRFISSQMMTHERTVNHVIEDALQRGMPEARLLRRLRETWHLAPRMAQAVTNHERALINRKVPANRRNRLVSRYLDRVTRQRADTISTTESITLFNMARDRAWQEAVRKGQMPVDTVKMWVTERDELVCEICKPMDGQTTPLGESFTSTAGNPIVPAVHPRCRCQIVPVREVADVSGSEFIFPVKEGVSKHLGGPDGTDPHPSGTPQSVHAGFDEAIANLKEAAYDLPMSWLKEHIRGSGIRIGQRNRIKGLANSILEDGFTKPITMWVYEDGPFIRDGMHRLEAAHMLGLKRIPVAVHHVEGNRPKNDLRGRFHAWRIRREGPQPKRDTPFDDVKDEQGFVRWFNQRQAKKGERIADTGPKKQPETAWERLRDVVGKREEGPVRWPGVSKHLGGSSGDKDHPSGTPQSIHGKEGMGAGEYIGEVLRHEDVRSSALAAGIGLAYVGLIALPFVPASAIASSVKNLPQVPKNLYKSMKSLKEVKNLPSVDRFKYLASYLNDGGKMSFALQKQVPEAKQIHNAIKTWTSGGQKMMRDHLTGVKTLAGPKGKEIDALGMAIASAPKTSNPLFRGMSVSDPKVLKAYTTKGNTFHLGPTGFSSDLKTAKKFASGGYGFANPNKPTVVMTLRPNAQALRAEKHANITFKWEREWLSSGRYRVADVKQVSNKRYEVVVEQVDAFIPKAYKMPTVQKMIQSQDRLASTIKTQGDWNKTPALFTLETIHGQKWWKAFGYTDDAIGQTGVLSHGWIAAKNQGYGNLPYWTGTGPKVESILALTKRKDN